MSQQVAGDAGPAALRRVTITVRHGEDLAEHRRQLTEAAVLWGRADIADDVCLVAMELGTNALRHGEGDPTITLIKENDGILVSVWDASPTLPRVREASLDDEGGRGLAIVAGLAREYDWQVLPSGGKTVCAYL
ncbi:MAG: ATP-binding protein [Streptosporangiaceae bacterium]